MEKKPCYFSFLMRLWLAGDDEQPQWRASLEDARTGQRIGFASLEALFEHLKQLTRSNAASKEVISED